MERKLSLYVVMIFLENNNTSTRFRTFAKSEKDAVRYITNYIENNLTFEYSIGDCWEVDVEEGMVLCP